MWAATGHPPPESRRRGRVSVSGSRRRSASSACFPNSPHRHGVVYVYLAGTAAARTELQNSPGARRAGVVALAHLFLPLTICRIRMTERKRERVDGRWSHVVDRLCSIGSQSTTVVICVSCRPWFMVFLHSVLAYRLSVRWKRGKKPSIEPALLLHPS